ncbi:MAG: O-antigen ligase family protein [Oligoflexia bacterium]|nr:O-antigen ligase family protein [Oligoflexia bacterium]
MSGFYLLTLVAVSIPHAIALWQLTPSFQVNAEGSTAGRWVLENIKFAFFYLMFPVLCFLHSFWLRRATHGIATVFLGSVSIFSAITVFYQRLVPASPMNHPFWGMQRFGGLFTDPNASGLTAFLCLPVFLSAAFREKSVLLKCFHILVILALAWNIAMSGSRSVALGSVALVVLTPLVFGVTGWCLTLARRRAILGILPVALMIAALMSVPWLYKQTQMGGLGLSAQRLALTWEKYSAKGVRGVFYENEARGKLFETAVSLIRRSPLSGWGPGGFYREYSNATLLQGGSAEASFDSALNHYLMVGGDFGLPIAALNFLLLLLPLGIAVKALPKLKKSERITAVWLLSAQAVFLFMIFVMPPSYFPETICVWTAELVYLASLGRGRRSDDAGIYQGCRWAPVSAVAIFAGVFLFFVGRGSYETSFGALGYTARHHASWWPAVVEANGGAPVLTRTRLARSVPLSRHASGKRIFLTVAQLRSEGGD